MTKSKATVSVKAVKAVKAEQVNVPVTEVKALMSEKMLYTEVKDVEAAIVKAHKTTKGIQLEYQRIAVSVIAILEKHRDIRVVRNLFKSMTVDLPEGLRVDSMQAFFTIYAPVTFDGKTQEAIFNKKGSFRIQEAMQNAWWLAKPRQFLKAFDLQKEINDLYAKAVKRRENPKQDEDTGAFVVDNIDLGALNALKKLITGGNTTTAPKAVIPAMQKVA